MNVSSSLVMAETLKLFVADVRVKFLRRLFVFDVESFDFLPHFYHRLIQS